MQGARVYWQIFAAAALWIIWKTRNACVFQNVKTSKEGISRQLKFTAYSWSRTLKGNFLNSHGLLSLWEINQVACLIIHLINRKDYVLNLMFSNYDLVGYTDGSLVPGPNDNFTAGMGGVLYNAKRKIVFLFSGPTRVKSPLQAEKEACVFMIKSLHTNRLITGQKIMLITDSYWLKKEMEYILLETSQFVDISFSLSISQCDREIIEEKRGQLKEIRSE